VWPCDGGFAGGCVTLGAGCVPLGVGCTGWGFVPFADPLDNGWEAFWGVAA